MRYLKNLFLIICLVFYCQSVAYADSIAVPFSYSINVGNEKYIFIMLGDGDLRSKNGDQFNKSGLYNNDGSIKPLWTVDFYTYQAYLTTNGKYLVEMGPWAKLINDKPDTSSVAFALYENGKKFKTYNVSDFISYTNLLDKSVSHYEWLKEIKFNKDKGELKILTSLYDYYVIDVKTGKVIFTFKSWYYAIILFSLIAVIVVTSRMKKVRNVV